MIDIYDSCSLCPRNCLVNRNSGEHGFCRETSALRIADIVTHYGEEPPISGKNGSGTVFFSGCSLRCCYCQNYQISLMNRGKIFSCEEVAARIIKLHSEDGIHNVNFVTPDHYLPHTRRIVEILRERYIDLPVIYNMSGFQKQESIASLEDFADIYLPDFKYADNKLAKELSQAEDYLETALTAISQMICQKGFLDAVSNGKPIASKGVLVRHLILPDNVQNSQEALTVLYLEFGRELPISLMSQYFPPVGLTYSEAFDNFGFLHRNILQKEFEEVYEYALHLGFRNMFVQFPRNFRSKKDKIDYVPDFESEQPFRRNQNNRGLNG
jgi:putative pyruvate formate lyase activating enzyme